jgi:ATP-dependent DNA helicase RecQ
MLKSIREQAEQYLRRALDNPQAGFRDGQWDAIESLVRDRERLLVVQRTGWGKSMVYFLATRLLRDRGAGFALLISPLLALMRNQIQAAERIGIRAATINSSNREDWKRIEAKLREDEVDLLLVSPERLANDDFREHVLIPVANRIGLFVVDEAHCISDWGHDFRPDYRRILRILQALPPNIPLLTTTATANNRVVEDIREQLGQDLRIVRGPLARESLRLQNISLPSQAARMAWLAENVPTLPGSGIIYTLTVRDSQRVAEWLQLQGISAHAYHSEVEPVIREQLEADLLSNKVKALVATTALGMGFDKPDLGFVIHFQRPGSVIHYYQQVGRAGRAMENAYGVLLSGSEDDEITDYFIRTAFPPQAHVEEVLSALAGSDEGLSTRMLEKKLNLSFSQIDKVLSTLVVENPGPIGKLESRWHLTPVAYVPNREKAIRLMEVRRREQARMQAYMRSTECLMMALLRELDDPVIAPCGKCAVCNGEPILSTTYSTTTATEAVRFLRRRDLPIEPRKLWDLDSLNEHYWHGKIPDRLRAQAGRSLCHWGDAGWGDLVRRGKLDDLKYADELATGAAEMVRARWKPEPSPTWITCVPSLKHPELVPGFAHRLAELLGLPFSQCVHKVKSTAPQKEMHNSFQQARNLAGAFKIDRAGVRIGPVLLVDDMVDSRWTFTVISALLLESGSGPVFPLALAVTTSV